MKTVYAVNSGTYSDYRIDAVFSSRKLAEEFMAFVKSDDYNDIEEFQIDIPTTNMLKRGYSIWRVHMLVNGDTERIDRTETDKYDIGNANSHNIWKRTEALAFKGKGIPDILTSNVWAKTQKQAVKIVNEKRIQMIASGKFK